ncbi:MAG TPA: TetR/AcrR family transcriptional regulator [Burkholderiaceae bacterium]|nr:TetR/AcrR family transcriptional regulator [Burkholderiaceae bacterium]
MNISSEPAAAPKPRWERRKQARPSELVAAALELFVEKGYAGTRLEDVAAHAGVSKGTLYLYFENKEDLFKAVVRENVVARISASADELLRFDGTSAELLSRLIGSWWLDYGDSKAGGLGKLVMAESGNFPEIARFFLEEVIEPWHQLLATALRRGIEQGEFRPVDTAMFVRVVTAPLVMLSLWKRSFGPCSQQPVDADAYLSTHVDMVLASLRPE